MKLNIHVLCLALTIGCLSFIDQANGQQELPSGEAMTPRIVVPIAGRFFDEYNNESLRSNIYRPVADLAQLPQPLVPIQPSTADLLPNDSIPVESVQVEDKQEVWHEGEVALVNYEEGVAEAPASLPSINRLGDPFKSFGSNWLFPVNAEIRDRQMVTLLGKTLKELAKQVEDSETTDKTKETLKQTLGWHQNATDHLATIARLRKDIVDAPKKLLELQKAMSDPLPEAPTTLDENLSIDANEAMLKDLETHLEQLRNEVVAAEKRIEERPTRITRLSERKQKLTEIVDAAVEQSDDLSAADLPTQIDDALQRAENLTHRIELRLVGVEQEWLNAVDKNTFLSRDVFKRQRDHAQATSARLVALISQRRDQVIKAEVEKARHEATIAHPVVRELAEGNARLAEEWTKVIATIRSNVEEQDKLNRQLDDVVAAKQKLDDHLKAAGHSRAVGQMLRFERGNLPQTHKNKSRITEIESLLPQLGLKRLERRQQLDQLSLQQESIAQTISKVNPDSGVSTEKLAEKATELLGKKREYLHELNRDYEKYLNGVSQLQQSHSSLIKKIRELRTYIDQHVLWIRSAEPIDSSDFRQSANAIRAIGTSTEWQSMVGGLSLDLITRWPVLLMIATVLLLGFGMRKQLDRRLRNACVRKSQYRLSGLLRGLLLTLLQAMFLPALVFTIGWVLAAPYEIGSMKDSISKGLLLIAPQILIASIISRLAIRDGLAETQLGWTRKACDLMRAAMWTITVYCLPLMAVTCFLEKYDDGLWIDSLGRMFFITAMLVFAFVLLRLLRGIRKEWKADPDATRNLWAQTSSMWGPALVLAPLALAGVASLGFLYSSIFLGSRVMLTWWLIVGIVASFYVVRRIIDVGHNIVVARRIWRRPAEKTGDEETRVTADQNELRAIKRQVTRLLHVASIALFLILASSMWQEVLPAVKALDHGLWQIQKQVENVGPNKTIIAVTQLSWITVGDIFRFILALVVTFVLSRNLPGLLQLVILDRLPIDRGGKYAITIVSRYLVAAFGVFMACRLIGFSWSSVQWLVAAMSVGLGFGLQEIFANFVAGIIILLERPIRVGDLVTVNGTTGFVTRIQLRATMIMDYDRRELIVPNKKFITDDVINWTLTDSVTRIVVPVGVAYGSDTQAVQSTLLKVAREHPIVLKEPRPEVIFGRFGDSSLDFELRVHIPNRDNFATIVHQLHVAIDREFRRQKIEIAFPQQDLHLKGIEPLLGSMIGATRKKAG